MNLGSVIKTFFLNKTFAGTKADIYNTNIFKSSKQGGQQNLPGP